MVIPQPFTSSGFIIAGTGTDVGKTMVSALLMSVLQGCYWKPIQTGISPATIDIASDRATVQRLSSLPPQHFIPETYNFEAPLSPHIASELENRPIDTASLFRLPNIPHAPLIIESAGGIMVPITRQLLQYQLYQQWKLPVLLVASTGLGTINHSLLSLAALRAASIPLLGMVFVGPDNKDNIHTITTMGDVPSLGWVPWLDNPDTGQLQAVFSRYFASAYFGV
ncbi:MAG: dethiobiotin synthase [Alphaproteobacteria bacterium]